MVRGQWYRRNIKEIVSTLTPFLDFDNDPYLVVSKGKQYYFLDGYPATYGYNRYNAEQSFRIITRYTLPLWYPDIGIRGTIFFKRLFATVFYDYSKFTKLPTSTGDFLDHLFQRSYGFDLNFDLVIFRVFPIRLGVRTVYRIDAEPGDNNLTFEFLLYSISF